VSEENRSTARDRPLARPVNEPQLARPVSGEPEETDRVEDEQQQAPRAAKQEESPRAEEEQLESPRAEEEQLESARAEGEQGEKGLIDRAVDEARERGLVSGQSADEIREKSKGFIEKVKDRLSGR
jgi:hypothetical protein